MTEVTEKEPLSSSSDSSFIILGPGSLQLLSDAESFTDVIGDKKHSSLIKIETSVPNNLTFSKYSEGSDINGTNDDDKLNHLLRENYQLKETLAQNNLAIKSQLNTFFMWQQEVLKTHENHKQKFLETKDLILKLRAENANLKKQVDDIAQKSFTNADTFQQITSISNVTNNDITQKEIDTLKKEIRKFEGISKELALENEKLIFENKNLEEALKIAKDEILQLNINLEKLEKQKVFHEQINNDYKKILTENALLNTALSSDLKIQNLLKEIEEREKVGKLQDDLKKCGLNIGHPGDSILNTSEQLTKCLDKLDDMNVSFNKQNEKINSMTSWVSLAENNIKSSKEFQVDVHLISEIAQLKADLYQEGEDFKKKQETWEEMQNNFHKLLKDYKDLQEKLNLLQKDSLELQQLKQEVEKLSAISLSKDEELAKKQQECDKLKEDIKKLNLECEEVGILRVQVELYKTDFNDERQAREKLVGEKEDLAERIRFLENKIRDFEKNEKQKSEMESPESSSSSPPTSPLQSGNNRYVCPKCMFSFRDLKTCESHVDECLDIHFYP